MEQQIETLQQQLEQQEKMASLGMLSAGIAHEIQNPLNFVINFSKMSVKLVDDLADILEDYYSKMDDADKDEAEEILADLRENLARIDDNGQRANSIIQGILLVSRGKEDEYVPTDVCAIVEEYVRLSYHAMRANHKGFNISIAEDYQKDLPKVLAIPQDLSRAVLNVMNNACYAVWEKQQSTAEYKPEISVKVKEDEGNIVISIADNGKGMTDEVKSRLYEDFFTTKPIGQGTGLGMGIIRSIIEEKHSGKLSFSSQLGEGTCFTLTFPVKRA